MGLFDRVKGFFKSETAEVVPTSSEANSEAKDKASSRRESGNNVRKGSGDGVTSKQAQEAKEREASKQKEEEKRKAAADKAAHAHAKTAGPPAQPSSRQEFFADVGEAARYSIKEIIGKGSYGIVCSAVDNFTGEKVAIKKITDVFQHVSDATRILREIKLLRLLKHPDIVDIKHIMLPPNSVDYKDIYVVFELMETDLHQVIKSNDDLSPDHHQYFLYQMLRGLKYIHSAKVFHRDIKPKNILANSDCKLKICDFGLARPAFNDAPTTIFWTDYVATRWYRAPELCGSFFAKYSPSIDLWSVGCIFAEILLGKPLFPGRNVVHQLELITDLLGTPSAECIAKVRNEKARRFLLAMRRKPGIPFEQFFRKAEPEALSLLKRLLAFDPSDRPSAEQALADPYFRELHNPAREPLGQPISRLQFEFDRRKVTIEEVRELIYVEICEYHPKALIDFMSGGKTTQFNNPSALDNFKRQFMHLEANPGSVLPPRKGAMKSATSLPPGDSIPQEDTSKEGEAEVGVRQVRAHSSMDNAEPGNGLTLTPKAMARPTGIPAKVSRYLTSQVSAPAPRTNKEMDSVWKVVAEATREAGFGGGLSSSVVKVPEVIEEKLVEVELATDGDSSHAASPESDAGAAVAADGSGAADAVVAVAGAVVPPHRSMGDVEHALANSGSAPYGAAAGGDGGGAAAGGGAADGSGSEAAGTISPEAAAAAAALVQRAVGPPLSSPLYRSESHS